MRAPVLVLPALAALLAGCDLTPTAPDTRHPVQAPERALLTSSGWTLVTLPFQPYAMNDAGVVVGTVNGQAVRWENGTLTILPGIFGLSHYVATSISPGGVIAGYADSHVLLWKTPSSTPIDISGAVSEPFGVLVNDNLTVAFNTWEKNSAGQWTPRAWETASVFGIPYIAQLPSGTYGGQVTGLNDNGYASGWEWTNYNATGTRLPTRWNASRGLTMLPFIDAGGYAAGINGAGDIVGNAQPGCSDTTSDACLYTVMVWRLDGTVEELFDAPHYDATGISSMGRIIGRWPWTYLNGVVTNLSYPDTYEPELKAVNGCGSIVGWRSTSYTGQYDLSTGYLWKHNSCDILLVKPAF